MSDAGQLRPLYERALGGERRALGRLVSLLERGGAEAEEISGLTHESTGHAHVVGMTGAPGAGKSTLTGALLTELAKAGRRPAVLAVDPSSPVTGGAILGDRIRMGTIADSGFVRSMATRGHRGGLSIAVPDTVRLLDAVGYDPVLIETTGVGQAEIDIVRAADTTVLTVAPGWGDAIQANKAGLIEVADVLVVNKADRPGAADARRDLELMLDLGHVSGHEQRIGRRPQIVLTTATSGDGVAAMAIAIDDHRAHLEGCGELKRRRRQRLRREIGQRIELILSERRDETIDSDEGQLALSDAQSGAISPSQAARRLALSILARHDVTGAARQPRPY